MNIQELKERITHMDNNKLIRDWAGKRYIEVNYLLDLIDYYQNKKEVQI